MPHMSKVHVADERGLPTTPTFGQVSQPNGNTRDAGALCVEDPVESGQNRRAKRQFDQQVEVKGQAAEESNCQHDPREDRSDKEISQQAKPDSPDAIERSHDGVVPAKSEE